MIPENQDNRKPAYLVLARKYRPKQFREVVGQEAVVRTIQNAIKENRIGHAYLFSGMRGVGKTTVARILAKALNCEHGPTPEPCNQCFMCQAINEESLLDFIEIDGASNRGIEDVKALRESIQYEPMHSRYRVIIIDEVHQLSRDAFNALLKTLEEPPTRTIFIFATTEFHKVPKTIASRCQHFVFKRLSVQQIVDHLKFIAEKENIEISPYSLKLIAEAADGSLRDAETLLDMVISFSGSRVQDKDTEEVLGVINRNLFEKMAGVILRGESEQIFPLVDSLVTAGIDLKYFYSGLIEYFRQLLLVKISSRPENFLLLSEEEIKKLREMADDFRAPELLRYLLMLQDGESGLRYSSQPRIFLEAWLLKLCYLKELRPVEQVLQNLTARKAGAAGPRVGESPPASARAEERKPARNLPGSRSTGPKNHLNSSMNNGPAVFPDEMANNFYLRVMKEKPVLAPILKMASRVEVNSGNLVLNFSRDRKHYADPVNQSLPYLTRLWQELGGQAVELKLDGETYPAPGTAPSSPDRTPAPSVRETSSPSLRNFRDEEARNLLDDPKARALMNSLKAQVITVKKKDGT
ncbi:MAG: DNA polymerase III subunit gamma/tau [Candidatus Saccharicenans sp.]